MGMIEEKSAIYWLTVKIINPVIKTLKNLLKKSDE